MPRKTEPIDDESLAGLVMAVTAEAQRAGWKGYYAITYEGSLVIHLHHPSKRFATITADDSTRLVIERIAEEVIPDA
jgi:hypothetical protein